MKTDPNCQHTPDAWGPAFWFTLHNSALCYPQTPSVTQKYRMKGFIEGILAMLPCEDCHQHAHDYLSSRLTKLDTVVSSRDNLFAFYVDFHNAVNIRKDKPTMSVQTAYNMYANKTYKINFSYS